MAKRIIFTRASDGGVSIVELNPHAKMAQADAILQATGGAPHTVVDEADIPTDRTFRNAWRQTAGSVVTDIPEARVIAHEKRRRIRDNLFAPLDRDATIPAKSTQAESARQVIRDKDAIWQTEIDAASTEAELIVVINDALAS